MSRRILWLPLAILLGLFVAALAVAVPAQAARTLQGPNSTNHDDPPGSEVYGIVESLPNHLVGNWTVSGVTYSATLATHFRMSAGPFYNGACVRVRFDPNSHAAFEIETQFHYKCSGATSQVLYGLIDEVPATDTITGTTGVTATWVISGMQFISTPATHFETDNGPLAVGACAAVKYRTANNTNLALEIRSEGMYRCLGPISYNQAFGYVDTFPSDLIGTWEISDSTGMSLTFMSTASTLVFSRGLPLQTGTCVGVKYYNNQGVNNAVLVMTREAGYCEGHFLERQPLSKIYASVDARPSGVYSGTWTLAGVNFTATQTTRVDEENGPLAVGKCAEGKYDPTNGAMLLYKLEGEEAEDCQTDDGTPRFKLYGVVEMMPTGSYTGTWQVSGVTFQAISSTQVERRHGDFAIGAYVKVYFTYDATTGARTAQVLKTHVAPGYGLINFHGRFNGWKFSPAGDQVIVDGKTINADPDIDVPASLKTGDQVVVNAYQDGSATYATQISLARGLYLPLLQR